ncbi:cyclic nucleotide-binding domain-containing thioredoxin-disulfide reductase [Agromyces sp. LHK192]|uniref:FAD-dependent oxidoreductase n=1 Tax=Agromyces sp. LHK192 TaxID=2498704 RepID=UPI000FDCC986|nr:cyclic nucleotide-binding domain-containing thioredoxin-disulfide reductase [Agromyces sp. LHK192]
MITVELLRSVPIFSTLPEATLAGLARAAEDIHLSPGEYFAHEGDERALFVVIEGGAEITKVVNGEERVIGTRRPGRFFGEVPMTLSTPFPASGRAAPGLAASRILKLDVTAFYTLAAQAPSVPARVAALARRYLDSLQAIAAEVPETAIRLVGPRNEARTHRIERFLTRNQVAFDRVAVEGVDGDHDERPGGPEPDERPVLETADGDRLVDPTLREVAVAAGLDVEPASAAYDVVILGAGPAGLTAAVNGAAEGLRTVVIESLAPGGQAGTSTRIENYTGFPFGISGDDLASRALKQAKRLGAEIVVTRTVEAIETGAPAHVLVLDGGERLHAAVVIVSTGVEWRDLPVDGVDRYLGNGVFYGAARSDAAVAKGADVCIIGAGNSAGQAALFFSRHARSVTMLVRGESLEASMSRYLIDQLEAHEDIRIETRSEVVGLHGVDGLDAIDVADRRTGTTLRRDCDVVFVMIGADAVTGWMPAEIARDDRGYVLTGADAASSGSWTQERPPFALETSVPGVFAVGDVRSGSVKRVAAGVGEGGMAIAFVHRYLALPREDARA